MELFVSSLRGDNVAAWYYFAKWLFPNHFQNEENSKLPTGGRSTGFEVPGPGRYTGLY
jgi:hypothetical protein